MIWVLVVFFISRFLRETDRARRKEWLSDWLKEHVIKKSKNTIASVTRERDDAEREKAALQDKLRAAQELVKQVMSEGGRLLDTYHLNYSDINFSPFGIEGRHKLGDGSYVCALYSVMHHLTQPARASFARCRYTHTLSCII